MRNALIALAAGLFSFASIQAFADDTDVKPMTAAQTAQYQAEHKAAQEKWAKKRSDLSGIEKVGQNNDTYVLPW